MGQAHASDHTCMSTVTDPITGNKTSDPATVLDSVKSFFQHQQAHIGGNKHGEYGDRDDLRNYPFSQPEATDSFILEPHPGINRGYMSKAMTDEMLYGDLFRTTLTRSSNHKAPGPDGIPNELLKHSDTTFLDALSEFMVCIWFTT